jgi:predicted RNA-binding Zn-ribbon protein involved in translation (DUF1610 family)
MTTAAPPRLEPLRLPRVVEREIGVSEADALEVLEQIKHFPCPVCGAVEWGTLGALGNILVGLPAKTAEGEPVATAEEWGSLDGFPFTCRRCGFVRLHSKQVMLALSEYLPDEAT